MRWAMAGNLDVHGLYMHAVVYYIVLYRIAVLVFILLRWLSL